MRATVAAGNPARKYDIADHLFFKLQGATPGALSESVEVVKKIVRKHGGDRFWPAKTQEEAEAVWTDRKNGLYTGLAYAGEGAKAWTTDVWCVKTSTHHFSPRPRPREGFSINSPTVLLRAGGSFNGAGAHF
jgi:D-lactate dehydrogenase (cytochrome)